MCAGSVIPALFPFLAVSGTLVAAGGAEMFAPLLSGLMTPLYRLPGQAGGALILGFLGGYPVGARTAAAFYQNGGLTRDEAERLLGFCNNANPAFLLNIIGLGVFDNIRVGIWLLMIHIAAAALTGLLFFRGTRENKKNNNNIYKREMLDRNFMENQTARASFFGIFVESVGNAALAALKICGFIVFFYTLATPLRGIGGYAGMIFTGFVDLFSVTPMLSRDAFGFVIAAALSGWGGCGVLCQTAAALEHSGLSVKNYIIGKAAQGILSGLLAACVMLYHADFIFPA